MARPAGEAAMRGYLTRKGRVGPPGREQNNDTGE